MTTRMLIDARHREETRVAVVKGNRIEEFDFESAEHKQLKGNIYLAKVTRVEPSLQAAFVDYGGNRHGFLAFAEIHPDYYQIPKEDREALLREEAEHAAEEAALRAEEDDESLEGDVEDMEPVDHDDESEDNGDGEGEAEAADREAEAGENGEAGNDRRRGRRGKRGKQAESEADEVRRRRMALRRRYKIQDVIHRRQVLLVQVVKEERGNKGAALTSYLSLAGRYCVLMPNTSHGGGISRKISNVADRKRLKTIISDMNLPSTMGCIVRTAGLQRTKPEIKRDFDYLARLWDEIREKTLKSAAPALIHNDSDLIKRAIRDIYNKDIEEVMIEGEEGYRAAKDFMKLLMPSHAKKVQGYADVVSLFQRYGVEDQLAAMYHPVVQLKSGGYLVINPTEALVSIDINSGRSTREHGIEQTAVATNLEAAREIARQLRLRDMAGLVVIDFIDMEVNSNIRKVEKAMKEALKDDRARIQLGRISGFGLMEMSRQRLRTGVLEASTRECPHCEGTGLVRTASSAGLSALRLLEEEAARGRGTIVTLRASQEAAFYVLNNKRLELDEIERRYGVRIEILPDGATEGARMSVESSGPRPTQVVTFAPIVDPDDDLDIPEDEDEIEEDAEAETEAEAATPRADRPDRGEESDGAGRRRRRRRRGRRGRREDGEGEGGEGEEAAASNADADDGEGELIEGEPVDAEGEGTDANGERRRSRRGRRGGRRRRGEGEAAGSEAEAGEESVAIEGDVPVDGEPLTEIAAADAPVEADAEPAAKPATRRRPRARKADAVVEAEASVVEAEAEAVAAAAEVPAPKPRRSRKKVEGAPAAVSDEVTESAATEAEAAPKPKRASRARKTAVAAKDAPVDSAPEPEGVDATVTEAADTGAILSTALAEPVESAAEAGAVETAGAGSEDAEEGEPRRGWWQRTFGN